MTVDIATLAIRVESLEAKNATRELERLRDTGGEAEESTNGLTVAARKLQDVLKMVAGAAAAVKLYELVKEATLLASRYNELGIVMGVVGRNAGHTAAELSVTEAALRKTGISATQSRDAITKLISANIDLSKATDLARLAQDAAVIGGMNSSEAFGRLIKGIQSAEKETLETMGLNVNFQRSYDALAKSLGKTSKDLTTVEKTQAAVNAVMEKAPAIAGSYEASLTNSGKQMRSMARYIEDLKVQLGQPFQNPFGDIISASTQALKLALDNAGAIRSVMEGVVNAILPVMKVAAAYFALFVAAPAIYAAAAAALWPVISALAVYAMNVAIGQTATIGFNTVLFGTSVAAQLAAGSLTKLALAVNILFGLFAGWQIGEYLDKQFVQARIAGEVMAGGILEAWEHIKLGGILAFEALTSAGRAYIKTMLGLFASWTGTVATGMRKMGFEDKAAQLDAFAGKVRAASDAQGTFASRTAAARAEHEKNLKVIEQDTSRRITAALAEDTLSEATRDSAAAAAKAAKEKAELTEAQRKAFESAVKNAKEYIAALKIEAEEIGKTESQLRIMRAAREAAKAPTAELKREIMAAATALDQQATAHDKLTKSQERAKKGAEAMEKIFEQYRDGVEQSIENAVKEAEKNEELARTFGMTKGAIEALELARLEEQLAQRASTGLTIEEIESLEKLIDAKKRSADAAGKLDGMEAAKKAGEEWKKQAESLNESLTDALLRGFESGKGFGKNLVDTIKNMFNTMVLRPVISAIVNPVAGALGMSGVSGAASAGTGASGMLGNIGSSLGMVGTIGSIAAGAVQTAGAIMSGTIGFGSTLSAGMAAISTGTASGISAGLASVAGALGPIALGLGAAVAIWKKLDTSGTYHTGGAAQASSAGITAISARSLNMENIRASSDTQKLVGDLAQGVVGILDSTAMAFGKTAGYTAATAFADDTSKDGAWGSLVISKLGQSIVNWQDTRGNGKWAQKTFADGEEGQKQYLAALSASVRTALDSIGLPAWAKKMLDGVGSGASIDELAKVVDQINLTQRALASMKDQLPGFKSLSESAISALMAASGGIESLATNAGAYFDNFMSAGEKSAATIAQITEALKSVGVEAPATREAFRAELDARMKLGEAQAPAVAMLFKVAGAFAQVYPELEATTAAARTAADILAERNDLQKQYDELTLTSAQLLNKQRLALDASNRGLFDHIQVSKAAKAAQDAAKTSLGDVIDKMRSFGESARSLRDGLLTGSLSTLTPEQQYAELERQYQTTRMAGIAGDTKAQSNFASIAQAFLTASQKINGGDARYSSDFAGVLRDSEEITKWTTAQVDVAQASLDAMNAQVVGIGTLNDTMLAAVQGIAALPAAIAGPNYAAMGSPDKDALVAEIKALRMSSEALVAEVKGLREDQPKIAGAQMQHGQQVAEKSTRELVSSLDEFGVAARSNKVNFNDY